MSVRISQILRKNFKNFSIKNQRQQRVMNEKLSYQKAQENKLKQLMTIRENEQKYTKYLKLEQESPELQEFSKQLFDVVSEKDFLEYMLDKEIKILDNLLLQLKDQTGDEIELEPQNIDDASKVALVIRMCVKSQNFQQIQTLRQDHHEFKLKKKQIDLFDFESLVQQKRPYYSSQTKQNNNQNYQVDRSYRNTFVISRDNSQGTNHGILFDKRFRAISSDNQLEQEANMFLDKMYERQQQRHFIQSLKKQMYKQMEQYDKLYYQRFASGNNWFSIGSPVLYYMMAQQNCRELYSTLDNFKHLGKNFGHHQQSHTQGESKIYQQQLYYMLGLFTMFGIYLSYEGIPNNSCMFDTINEQEDLSDCSTFQKYLYEMIYIQ